MNETIIELNNKKKNEIEKNEQVRLKINEKQDKVLSNDFDANFSSSTSASATETINKSTKCKSICKFVLQIISNLLQCAIHYSDILVDILLCYEYYTNRRYMNFVFAIVFLFLPNFLISTFSTIFKLAENSSETKWYVSGKPSALFLMKQILFLLFCSLFNLFILMG